MAEGIDTGSFEFYEGIRILIPGAVTLGLADGVARTVNADHAGLGLGTFNSFVAALLVGLLFYFIDAPNRAASVTPLRPTDRLKSWKVETREGTSLVNNYMVILDEKIPAPIRARALYMGSMFRIGFEIIYLLALFSAAVLSGTLLSTATLRLDGHREPREIWIAGGVLFAIWIYSIYVDRTKEKKATDAPTKHFSWLDVALIAVVSAVNACLYYLHQHVPSWALAIPIAALLALWALRYFRGYADGGPGPRAPTEQEADTRAGRRAARRAARDARKWRKRRPIAATHACLLLLAAQLSILVALDARPFYEVGLSRNEVRAWLACAVAAQILTCARGHEKRLRGAYVTQNTWLELHREAVVHSYFTGIAPTPGTDQEAEQAVLRAGSASTTAPQADPSTRLRSRVATGLATGLAAGLAAAVGSELSARIGRLRR